MGKERLVLNEEEIKERDTVIRNLEKALLDLSYLSNEPMFQKGLLDALENSGIRIGINDDGLDYHEYLIRLLPEVINE